MRPFATRAGLRLGCVALLLGALTFAIYAQAFDFPFVNWDDPLYVTKNPRTQQGLTAETVVWAFTETDRVNWHPLTWLSHALDCELYGLDASGHHVTSVLVHLANSVLLYALFAAMTGAPWCSALLALLFAIHPLHVESVAWVSDRKDLLCTFLSLLSTWAYVAYARRGGLARYSLVALLLSLALMAKSMAVTLPFVFLLLDYWPLRRAFTRATLAEKLPLLLLSAATCVVTFFAQRDAGAMIREHPLPAGARLANAIVSYGRYLEKTVWPSDLTFFYPHPYIPESGGLPLAGWEVGGFTLLLCAVTLVVLRRREQRWALVGWLWFLGTLVPVIGLVQVGHQGMSDRYMYFPSIGLLVLAAWGAGELRARLATRRGASLLAACAGTAALTALTVAAWKQTSHWSSSMALFRHAVEAVPRNPTIRFNLANHLRDAGETEQAIANYRQVLEETPDDVGNRINLANLLRERSESDEAILLYRQALEREPENLQVHVNLGAAHRARGELESARLHYEKALAIAPSATAEFNLANLLASQGRLGEAIAHYREALRLEPRDARVHNNLGSALLADGRTEAAIQHFRAALELEPRHHRAANNLGAALQQQGQLDAAIAAYRRALELQPDYASAQQNLADALRAQASGAD